MYPVMPIRRLILRRLFAFEITMLFASVKASQFSRIPCFFARVKASRFQGFNLSVFKKGESLNHIIALHNCLCNYKVKLFVYVIATLTRHNVSEAIAVIYKVVLGEV